MNRILKSFSHELRTPLNNSITKLTACIANFDENSSYNSDYELK
jgi:hypothetical protein